jgi:putative ATP-dependent endonuclease of OLD family
MKIAAVWIQNFRGIRAGTLYFGEHVVLVGDNNTGKSTILEALDLVLGPERLSRRPPIDEHDFYGGRYRDENGKPIPIDICVIVTGLSADQQSHFRDHLEWWNDSATEMLQGPPPEGTDSQMVQPALRLMFTGEYDEEEDDFLGNTFFCWPISDSGERTPFRTPDKRHCGFLFLRTVRTGSKALSLERGSLLDVILRLQKKRLHMWEEVLSELRTLPVAAKPELGINDLLSAVQDAVRHFVPSEWSNSPHLRVSDLTRESLRRVLTVFMGTGVILQDGTEYAAPYQHQGTGTINTLVLALLSLIADLKQNVIFAMEEPEIAIPPHTQKRIVDSVRSRSAQALFTSHSPYVLGEFDPSQMLVLRREDGVLTGAAATYPPAVKPKAYRDEIRTRFCEAVLARRVLITEGRTEYDAFPAAARRLSELNSADYSTFEALGVAVINAQTESQVAPLGHHFKSMGKTVLAVFDKQTPEALLLIEEAVHHPFECSQKGLENLVLAEAREGTLRRFAVAIVDAGEWPRHLNSCTPTVNTPLTELKIALTAYFGHTKGSGTLADFLYQCEEAEMPSFITNTIKHIRQFVEPPQAPIPEPVASTD